jgi:hypothetical protein
MKEELLKYLFQEVCSEAKKRDKKLTRKTAFSPFSFFKRWNLEEGCMLLENMYSLEVILFPSRYTLYLSAFCHYNKVPKASNL